MIIFFFLLSSSTFHEWLSSNLCASSNISSSLGGSISGISSSNIRNAKCIYFLGIYIFGIDVIDITAHELRTLIQPILGLSHILLSKTGNIEQYNELLSIINRNAKRLNRLSDDILDATKIESKSLELKKEQFNLNDVILHAIDDILLGKRISSENLQLL